MSANFTIRQLDSLDQDAYYSFRLRALERIRKRLQRRQKNGGPHFQTATHFLRKS